MVYGRDGGAAMPTDRTPARLELKRAAYILLATAGTVGLCALPTIPHDAGSAVIAGRSVPLLWVVCAFYTLAGSALLVYATRVRYRTSIGASLCIATAAVIGLWVGPLIDASAMYARHAGTLKLVAGLLSLSAAASLASAGLLLRPWLLMPTPET
jgi:hypothetical protein